MKKVELYSTHGCTYCLRIREFFSEHNVDYDEYNVEDDQNARERMIQRSGNTLIPTVFVGDDVLVGFDPKRLEALLQ